ncbi:MAG TPA: hypothetical protein VEI47_06780 [Gemmatimonadales bacterium]|nr:hypothetical protein [Gemmatimonadales bacterium]
MTEDDSFYVGYHPVAPATVAAAVRRTVLGLALIVLGSAAVFALAQRRADIGVFEYGHPRSLHGQIREFPYPSLLVPQTASEGQTRYARYLLVAEGKHGAEALVAGLDRQWADVEGTRIARPEREMLEVSAGGVSVAPGSGDVSLPIADLSQQTLTGEVVDSKCWLGVMKPATGTVHRGCASRCLSGGIPPILMTTDSTGSTQHYLLTDADGNAAPRYFAGLVGQRLTLVGLVRREGDLLVMRVLRSEIGWP